MRFFSLVLAFNDDDSDESDDDGSGPGSLPVCVFHYTLNNPLIESFHCCLVESYPVESYIVESQYFQYFCLTFPAQNFSSFNFQISNMFAISYLFAYSFMIMCMCHPIVPGLATPYPVRVLYSDSDDTVDQVTYILCLNGRVPKMHELWSLNAQGFREVHPSARV